MGGTLELHMLFKAASRLKATRGRVRTPKLRENPLAVSHGFCTKSFRSAMRPRIAFPAVSWAFGGSFAIVRSPRPDLPLKMRAMLFTPATDTAASTRGSRHQEHLLCVAEAMARGARPSIFSARGSSPPKARNSRVAPRVPELVPSFLNRCNLCQPWSRSRTRVRRGPRPWRRVMRRRRDSWRRGRCNTWRHCRSSRWCHGGSSRRCWCRSRCRCCSAGAAELQIVQHRVVIGGVDNDGVRWTRQARE